MQIPFIFQPKNLFRLDNFIITKDNQKVFDLLNYCLLKRDEDIQNAQTCCYLQGNSFSGKTHLVQGLVHEGLQNGLKIAYIPLSLNDTNFHEFSLAELVEFDIHRQLNYSFSEHVLVELDNLDLIVIEDIDLVANQPKWQHAILQLLEKLKINSGNLILTGRKKLTNILLPFDQILDLHSPNAKQNLILKRSFAQISELPMHSLTSKDDLYRLLQNRNINMGFKMQKNVINLIIKSAFAEPGNNFCLEVLLSLHKIYLKTISDNRIQKLNQAIDLFK